MNSQVTRLRRLFGVACISGAGVMLLFGFTVLADRLHRLAFLVYWGVCFFFTWMALMVALIDILLVRKEARREKRQLEEDAIAQLKRLERDDH